ncbi:Ldh family oxidoreductase [Streptomyces sp. NPDC052299]|uniref:Ldh family oxidoreductase n=1 Tax=Streptomyces sp. NPDC052299 TaxID=3155054 RepID=UPI003449DF35
MTAEAVERSFRTPATAALEWATRVFRVLGADHTTAQDAALALVAADLAGHPSHGVRLVTTYAHQADSGELLPEARPAIVRQDAHSTVIAGRRGLGAGAMRLTVRNATEQARRHGAATVLLTDHGHLGRLGLYVAQLSAAGMVGVLSSGYGLLPEEAVVAPVGGVDRVFDTNPWAFGFPAEGGDIIIDMSSAAISYNAVRALGLAGVPIPGHVAQDRHGQPCTDPDSVLATGSLLPAGGAVGYGLALAACGLAALAGGPPASAPLESIAGTFLLALDVTRYRPLAQYRRHLGAAAAAVRAGTPAKPGSPVRTPGSRGVLVRSPREVSGTIELSESTFRELEDTCHRMRLPAFPESR